MLAEDLDERGPDTERMPVTLPGLGLFSVPPAPLARESLPTLPAPLEEPAPDDVDAGWDDVEASTAVEVPRAHPQQLPAAACRCGAQLGQLAGEDAGVWACSAVLLGLAPAGLHDERVREISRP